MKALVLVVVLFSSLPVQAQTTTAWPEKDRSIANALSNAAVAANVTLDLLKHGKEAKDTHTVWQTVGCESLKYGATEVVMLGLKRLYHEPRPDLSSNDGWPSGHTMTAFASGWHWQGSLPIAGAAGYLRTAANRHWWGQVAAGMVFSTSVRLLVSHIPACRGRV